MELINQNPNSIEAENNSCVKLILLVSENINNKKQIIYISFSFLVCLFFSEQPNKGPRN